MTQIDQGLVHNDLLRSLAADDFAAFAPHLQHVELPRLMVLTTAGVVPTHAYFFESGLGSIIAKTREDIKTALLQESAGAKILSDGRRQLV